MRTSGIVLSRVITVVFGWITMAYDIYKLSAEVEANDTKRAGDDIRGIANQLEVAINSFLSGCDSLSNSVYNLNISKKKKFHQQMKIKKQRNRSLSRQRI